MLLLPPHLVAAAVSVLMAWSLGAPAMAQIGPPQTAPAARAPDAIDAVAAARRLDVSRAAVKDQVELCNDDAEKFRQVGRELKPDGAAGVTEWNEWGTLLRITGLELQSCLRAYKKQIGLLRADAKTLRDMLPAVKDAKRMTLNPKQLGEVTKSADDGEREIVAADQHVAALADAADQAAVDGQRALRQAGVTKGEPLPSFRNLL